MNEQLSQIKVAIFGDSISEGIGSRKVNYSSDLYQLLEQDYKSVIIDNYAYTGTLISYINDIKHQWENKIYDVIIIAYGNVDGMLRPNLNHIPNLYAYLPKRYKQNGMLNPRPYYSQRWYKSIGQHLDSCFRWHLNKFLLLVQGSTTWISVEDFEKIYSQVLSIFKHQARQIIMLSTVYINDKYFPGTNFSYAKYNNVIKCLADKNNFTYLNLYDEKFSTNEFYKDGFHPNEKGYYKIAKMIYEHIG